MATNVMGLIETKVTNKDLTKVVKNSTILAFYFIILGIV